MSPALANAVESMLTNETDIEVNITRRREITIIEKLETWEEKKRVLIK